MRILFIGGTGIISSACTQLASERGHKVCLLNRGQRPGQVPAGIEVIKGDIRKPDEVASALTGRTFDAVANFINFTPEDIERDLRLFAGKTGHYVFISSASVYQKPLGYYRVTESTPLANPYWEYARNKIACEERLMAAYRQSGFPFTVVRPSLTYNDSLIPLALNSWSRSWSVVDRMIAGKKVIVPGDGTSLWTITHNSDFAKGFVGLLGLPQAIGHAFHITSDEVLSWDQYYRIVADAAGVQVKIIHIPSDLIAAHHPGQAAGLLGDKSWSTVLDNTKIKTFVPGYVATVSFREGMERVVARFRADAALRAVDHEFDAWCDKTIAAFERALPAAADKA